MAEDMARSLHDTSDAITQLADTPTVGALLTYCSDHDLNRLNKQVAKIVDPLAQLRKLREEIEKSMATIADYGHQGIPIQIADIISMNAKMITEFDQELARAKKSLGLAPYDRTLKVRIERLVKENGRLSRKEFSLTESQARRLVIDDAAGFEADYIQPSTTS